MVVLVEWRSPRPFVASEGLSALRAHGRGARARGVRATLDLDSGNFPCRLNRHVTPRGAARWRRTRSRHRRRCGKRCLKPHRSGCDRLAHMSWLAHISHFPLNRGRSRCASRANRAPLRRRRGAGREWRLRLRRSTTLPWWLYFETFCNERQVGADTAACWFRTVVNGYRIVCATPIRGLNGACSHTSHTSDDRHAVTSTRARQAFVHNLC